MASQTAAVQTADEHAEIVSRLRALGLDEFELTVRTSNVLSREDIHKVGELLELTRAELCALPSLAGHPHWQRILDEITADVLAVLNRQHGVTLLFKNGADIEALLECELPTTVYTRLKGPALGVHNLAQLGEKTEEELRTAALTITMMDQLTRALTIFNTQHGTTFGPKRAD